jgi:hypothetical protein
VALLWSQKTNSDQRNNINVAESSHRPMIEGIVKLNYWAMPPSAAQSSLPGKYQMSSSVEATRELCDDLDSLIEVAKQGRAPIRAICLIERARGDLQAYLDEIHRAEVSSAWSGLG